MATTSSGGRSWSLTYLWRILNWFIILAAIILCLGHNKSSIVLATLSISFFLLPACLLFGLTGQFKRAATIAATIVITTQLLAELKSRYYKDNLVASDFYMITDTSNWDIMLQYPVVGLAIAALVTALIVSLFSHRLERRHRPHSRIAALVAAIIIGTTIDIYRNDSQAFDAWLASMPRGYGTFTNLIFSSRDVNYSPPSFKTDDRLFLQQVAQIPPDAQAQSQHPDIVAMLQESTVDPTLYDLPKARLPEMEMFKPDKYTRAQGPLRVHTFGGRTWLSEFALLSGLVSLDFGSTAPSVYYTVTPHLSTSLVKLLKQNGYHTVVLIPSNKSAYHAFYAYQDFGFDEILQPQDLGYLSDPTHNIWHMPSDELNEYAKKILATRTDKPLFLFMLTINEHGPYDANGKMRYGLDQSTSDTALAHRLSDYISRIDALSKATEKFSDFLMQRKRPTMLFYFGDHQPNLESEEVKYSTELPNAAYLTQFVLRDNLAPAARQEFEVFDLSLAGGLILERAHLKADPLFNANIQIRKLSRGELKDYPDQQLIKSYKHYIYQTLAVAG